MAIIFQLFRAEDLDRLTPTQLNRLRVAVVQAMEDSSNLPSVQTRATTVFQQLRALNSNQPASPAEPSRTLLFQFFSPADLALLSAQQREILEWAIVCEVTHSRLALEAIRDKVYPLYESFVGGPPFNLTPANPTRSDTSYDHLRD